MPYSTPASFGPRGLYISFAAMVAIVTGSNVAVQFPINDWLTYGALTYPIAFLVTDLTARTYGAARARRVIYVGFAVAVVLSAIFATPRIAIASGSAFLIAQLIDVAVFTRLSRRIWWVPPLVSSLLASAIDTAIFFSLAFAGTGLPWVTWGIGDYGVKAAMAFAMLIPFRVMMRALRSTAGETARG